MHLSSVARISSLIKNVIRCSHGRPAKTGTFRRPQLNDIPLLQGCWKQCYQRNQKRYNTYIACSSLVFGVSLYALLTDKDAFWMLPDSLNDFHYQPSKAEKNAIRLVSAVIDGTEIQKDSTPVSAQHAASQSLQVEDVNEVADSKLVSKVSDSHLSTKDGSTNSKHSSSETNEANNSNLEFEDSNKQTIGNGDGGSTVATYTLPVHVPYLMIGAGTSAFSAFRSIKNRDPKAKVLMIGDEPYHPYMRPPLSKEFWYTEGSDSRNTLKFKQWNGRDKSVFYEVPEFFCKPSELAERENGGVAVATSHRVVKLDVERRIAHLEDGSKISYDKCLIATGARPRRLNHLDNIGDRVTYFRNISDYRCLEDITDETKSIVVIGGGYLGSELACSLASKKAKNKIEVIQSFPEKGNLAKVLPEYLSRWTTEKITAEGVRVVPESRISSAEVDKDGRVRLIFDNGKQPIVTDHVVVAIGVEPNTDLARTSQLEVDPKLGGFRVNAELEARSNVWVAGDAASFYDVRLGRRRVEHHDHAVVSGRLAGENMTGASKPYTHQAMVWSDLGSEVGFETIGVVDSSLPTVAVFTTNNNQDSSTTAQTSRKEEGHSSIEESTAVSTPIKTVHCVPGKLNEQFGKGVVFYTRENRIVGVLLWNVFNKMRVARQIINEQLPSSNAEELSRLFDLYNTEDDE